MKKQLGFKEIDEKRQKDRKDDFLFHKKMNRWERFIVVFIFGVFTVATIRLGIKAIADISYMSQFILALSCLVVMLVIAFGTERFLDWLFRFVFSRQNTEKLPKQSQRTLRWILNRMSGRVGVVLWNVMWGCIVFSALIVAVGEKLLTIDNLITAEGKIIIIYIIGYAVLSIIYSRRDLTNRMTKNTKNFYNFGDDKKYAEYVDWSIREHLLLACKQYVLTEEFLLGYAQGDVGFYPVAIPREFIKASEVRIALTADSKNITSKAIMACLLCNGKVVDFYLSRYVGNRMAVDLLKKRGFEFTVREDRVEYQ